MLKNYIFSFCTIFSLFLIDVCSVEFIHSNCVSSWIGYDRNCNLDLDLSIYGGYVHGKSLEIVYNNHVFSKLHTGKISQLDWEIKNLWVIGGTIHKGFFNNSTHLYVNGWNKGYVDKSTMTDRDYLDPVHKHLLTDISKSPNTQLKDAKMFDIALGYDFYSCLLFDSELSFTILGGYKYLEWEWKSYGGRFNYNYGDRVGQFPNVLIICYKQQFWIPYIGLKTKWNWNQWKIVTWIEYTNQAHLKDHDFHALRNATFNGTFKNGEYWVTGLEASLNIWRNIDLNIGCVYHKLNTVCGDSIQREGGYTIRSSDSIGIEHDHYMLTLGLVACF